MNTRTRLALLAAAFAFHSVATGAVARADSPATGLRVDSVAVRFYAAELGGPARPRFLTQRQLSFCARLEMLGEGGALSEAIDARYVREAAERHMATQLLAELPLERALDPGDVGRVASDLRAGLVLRAGGRVQLDAALRQEQLGEAFFEDLVQRHALAALYLERTGTPVLRPTEDQLRELFRIANHPFRGAKFEASQREFTRWVVIERLLVAEVAYFQNARSRVHLSYPE